MRGHDSTEQSSRVRRAGLGGRTVPRGPRPVRPRVVAVGVRPVQPAWPTPALDRVPPARGWRASALGVGQRVLARRTAVARRPGRPRGVLVTVGLMVATAVAVFGLGLLADVVSGARAEAPVGPAVTVSGTDATVTVTDEATVWEVAERVMPGASGAEVAAAAERIVTDNGLSSARVHPGQVLRVTGG
mgnify:CR=1 FL=1